MIKTTKCSLRVVIKCDLQLQDGGRLSSWKNDKSPDISNHLTDFDDLHVIWTFSEQRCFVGRIDIVPNFEVKWHRKPIIGSVNRPFWAKRANYSSFFNIKTTAAILTKFCTMINIYYFSFHPTLFGCHGNAQIERAKRAKGTYTSDGQRRGALYHVLYDMSNSLWYLRSIHDVNAQHNFHLLACSPPKLLDRSSPDFYTIVALVALFNHAYTRR